MAIIPHKYLDSVVSIGTKEPIGNINWFGTGFFVHRIIDKEKHAAIPFLISNKHVLEGVDSVIIRMIKKGTHDLKEISVPLKGSDGKEIYKCHPTADIAVRARSALANVHPVEFIREVVDIIQPKVV